MSKRRPNHRLDDNKKKTSSTQGNDQRSKKRSRNGRGSSRPVPHQLLYYAFWKPFNVLSQFTPAHGSNAETLSTYISIKDIYVAGRLDRDSEGLLLLSNDGLFQHKLCDPRFEHWRTYLVQVERTPTEEALRTLREGVLLKGILTKPARVSLLETEPKLPPRIPPIRTRKTVNTAWLRLSLTEGKNRQVRRMTAAVGFPTLRLVRESISLDEQTVIDLTELKPGEMRRFVDTEREGVTRLRTRKPSLNKAKHQRTHND